jgi:hypothetical protein
MARVMRAVLFFCTHKKIPIHQQVNGKMTADVGRISGRLGNTKSSCSDIH